MRTNETTNRESCGRVHINSRTDEFPLRIMNRESRITNRAYRSTSLKRQRCSSNERFGVTRCSDGLSLVVDRSPHRAGAIGDGASPSLGVM
ncbi:hypothetical protein ALC57_10833 [Trachymyrmex cornetzi]|uniref:Uncharacterized protein n=1 Tax=Trachymyrmex cornetzi TaxID=471704 RepID=A0A195DWB6_9HYME|nr:hypothetical protein ALC57_10833 [Trachymyrmex cornetzi]